MTSIRETIRRKMIELLAETGVEAAPVLADLLMEIPELRQALLSHLAVEELLDSYSRAAGVIS